MPTMTAPPQTPKPPELIPGYVLQERLGSGGYGDVWKAQAPGGLLKAVKIIHGNLDDARAERELKSLRRIKDVHHPFLLSLERIEAVDRRLVIVSELAEGSLKDRFDKCQQQGLPGIPRDELLQYLGDAADALDFLHEHHALQHLDVKPENLLIIGNHVKVADFGLLKDLRDTSASLVNGLTPTYAPPEVLNGRPHRHSDQYSLAIVYQEMLTGQRPFCGRTAAQLAAQHLHTLPDVTPLPPSEQPVLERALQKNPHRRYANCQEFVETLRKIPTRAAEEPRLEADPVTPRVAKTIVLQGSAANVAPSNLPETATVETLAPLDLRGIEVRRRPTVFVAVGGTAGKVLQHLRRHLNERFGDVSEIPTLQFLLVDTDRSALTAVMQGNAGSVRGRETLAMPLRSPNDYRAESQRLLRWISRRWLYNIPRSLQTEGLRPLGRLAFADHAESFMSRMRDVLCVATSPESLAAASQFTGLEFINEGPRVFILASLSGGTGGGAVLDLAYAVRKVLRDNGWPDQDVCGVLTHATGRKGTQRELAVANAVAGLIELQHFSQAGGCYPGDPDCGLPPLQKGNATFHDTYFVHLGDDLTDQQYQSAEELLAEYLYQNTITNAGPFFEAARQQEHQRWGNCLEHLRLRTFGLTKFPAGANPHLAAEEQRLCRELVRSWNEGLGTGDQAQVASSQRLALSLTLDGKTPAGSIEEWAAAMAERLGLHLERLVAQANALWRSQTGDKTDGWVEELVQGALTAAGSREGHARGEALPLVAAAAIDQTLGKPDNAPTAAPLGAPSWKSLLDRRMRQDVANLSARLQARLLQLIDIPLVRVSGAQRAAQWFAQHAQAQAKAAQAVVDQLERDLVEISNRLTNHTPAKSRWRRPATDSVDQLLQQYAQLRIRQLAHNAVQLAMQPLLKELGDTRNSLHQLSLAVIELREAFPMPEPEPAQGFSPGGTASPVEAMSRQLSCEVLGLMDRELHRKLAESQASLARALAGEEQSRCNLVAAVRDAARATLRRRANDARRHPGLALSGPQADDLSLTLREQLNRALPPLLQCGGAKRWLVVAPSDSECDSLQRHMPARDQYPATFVTGDGYDITLCCEAEQVPLANVLTYLVNGRDECWEAASRLHSRVDVVWSNG